MASSEPHIRERLQPAAVWMSGARVLSILLNMALQIVLARLLTPADFGTYALVTSVIGLTAIVGMFGMNEVSVRFIAGEMAIGGRLHALRAAKTVFGFAAFSIPAVALMAVVLCGSLGHYVWPDPSLRWQIAMLVASGGAALALQQLGGDALRGFHDLRWASLFLGGQAGGPLCVLVFVVLALSISMGTRLSLGTTVLLFVASITLLLPVTWSRLICVMRQRQDPHQAPISHSRSLAGDIVRMGVIMMGVHLLAFITQQADLWIGSQFLPREDLALYHAARKMVMLIGIPIQVSMTTIASTIAELRARQQHAGLQQLIGSAATVAAIPMLAALLALALLAKPLLGLVFGEYYQQAAGPLLILIIGYSALALCGNPLHVLNVAGGHGASLSINILSTIFLFSMAPWCTLRFGMNGLAAACAGSVILQNVSGWLMARRLLGVWTHPRLQLRKAGSKASHPR